MKIHRLVTENLNSLYGRTEIDLDEMLAGESLFLICGPTGSGKSTLMDAVSLALFGETPRLDNPRKETHKPWAIMSRGTGECLAEIEFSKLEVSHRARYRARWTCRRARKKPDGKLQKPIRSLERLEPDGSWKTLVASDTGKQFSPVFKEVLEGFGVTDFNRSMLLAQGRFDAFLKAPPDERARILERLTDTSVYQQIGERASLIRSRHAEKIKSLNTLVAAGGGLDRTALAELEARHLANTQQFDRCTQVHTLAKTRLDWNQEDQELAKKLTDTEAEIPVLAEAQAKAATQLERLKEHERCEQHEAFRHLDADAAAQRQHGSIQTQLTDIAASLPALQLELEQSTTRANASAVRAQQATAEIELLRPITQKADTSLAALKSAQETLERTRQNHSKLESQVRDRKVGLESSTTKMQEAEDQSKSARNALELLLESRDFQVVHQEQTETLTGLRARQAGLQQSLPPLKEIQERAGTLEAQALEMKGLADTIQKARGALETLALTRKFRVEQAEQAVLALAQQEKIAELELHRAELVEGEHCPLCGSTDHPWTQDPAYLDASRQIQTILNTAKQKRDETQTATQAAQLKYDSAESALRTMTARLELLGEQRHTALDQQLQLSENAQNALSEIDLPVDTDLVTLERILTELQAQVGTLETALEKLDRARHQVEKQALALEAERARLQGEQKLLALEETQRDQEAKQLETRKEEADAAQNQSTEAGTALENAWQQALRHRPTEPPPAPLPQDASPSFKLERLKHWAHLANQRAQQNEAAREQAATGLTTQRSKSLLLSDQLQTRAEAREVAQGRIRAVLAQLSLADASELENQRLGPDQLVEFRAMRTSFKAREVGIRTRIKQHQKQCQAHALKRPADLVSPVDHTALCVELENAQLGLEQARLSVQGSGDEMRGHERAQQALAEQRVELEQAENQARVWQTLHSCIGANNGSQFRQFAQSLNLGKLLERANVHLARLAKRYRLIGRMENGLPTLEFDLKDLEQAGARVATPSLSGGERFLVSLALALGLSDFRSVKMPIETLLLDEGFGTLDPETLGVALGALSQLQSDGRQVGIISHVAGIREQNLPRIEIKRLGGGRSEVQTH